MVLSNQMKLDSIKSKKYAIVSNTYFIITRHNISLVIKINLELSTNYEDKILNTKWYQIMTTIKITLWQMFHKMFFFFLNFLFFVWSFAVFVLLTKKLDTEAWRLILNNSTIPTSITIKCLMILSTNNCFQDDKSLLSSF